MPEVTLNLTEDQFNQLKETVNQLKTQDGLHTQDPAYIVYQRRPIIIDPDFCSPTNNYSSTSEDITWEEYKPDKDWDDQWLKEENLINHINEVREEEGEKPITLDDIDLDDYESTTMGYIDAFVGCFLTREAAQNHIDSNDYHYHKPYIFVESFYRNYEMINLRNILLNTNI